MTHIFRLILLAVFTFSCICINAQKDLYHFECKEGQNLESAMKQFAEDHDVKLGYPSYILNQIIPGAYDIKDYNLTQVLSRVLDPSDIEFKILEDGKILLRKISYYKTNDTDSNQRLTISGIIQSQKDSEPLEYATISIPSLQVGTYTEVDGSYNLDVNSSALEEEVVISFIGYESDELKVRDLLNQKKIFLKPSSTSIEEVTIQGSKPILIVNQLSASTEIQLSNFLSIGSNTVQSDDLLRKLQFLPGLGASDDKSSSIRIRGADESETLVLIDGIPIYKTDHFYGIFSNVNGNYVDDVVLYKNELPINYSGKSGGLVSMTSQNTIKSLSGIASIDLLNSSVSLGIPLNDKWSVQAAGRASYNEVTNAGFFDTDANLEFFTQNPSDFNRPTVLGVTPSFDFYDLNAKIAYKGDQFAFNANYFKSYDVLSSFFQNSFTSRPPRGSNRRINNQETFSNEESWGNNGASINFYSKFPQDWSLSSNSYYTEYYDNGKLNFSVTNDNQDAPLDNSIQNGNNNRIQDWASTLMVSKEMGNTSLNMGGYFVNHQNNLFLEQDDKIIFEDSKNSNEVGIFASANQQINKNLVINGGLRMTHYDLSDEVYLSPQLSAAYKVNPTVSFKGSYAINYQYVRELTYSNRFGEEVELFTISDGTKLPVGQSTNYMLGGSYKNNNWLFDIELYHIDRDNVLNLTTFIPQLLNDNGNIQDFRLLSGEGRTQGMDMMMSYQSKNYVGLLSYTLSKSENNFKEIFKDNRFPAQDDRRHQFSLTNTYKYNDWDFSANAVYSSGRVYTDLSLLMLGEDRRNKKPRDFLKSLPHYMRFDLATAYNFNLSSKKAKIELSVLNILDRNNVKYLQFTALVPGENSNNGGGAGDNNQQIILGTQTNQLDRTINLSFKLEF